MHAGLAMMSKVLRNEVSRRFTTDCKSCDELSALIEQQSGRGRRYETEAVQQSDPGPVIETVDWTDSAAKHAIGRADFRESEN